MDWLTLITTALNVLVIPAVGGWIVSRLRKPKDFERATEYKTIAQAAAALVMINNPNATWAQLLSMTISSLASQIPTEGARTRAAADAILYWKSVGGPPREGPAEGTK